MSFNSYFRGHDNNSYKHTSDNSDSSLSDSLGNSMGNSLHDPLNNSHLSENHLKEQVTIEVKGKRLPPPPPLEAYQALKNQTSEAIDIDALKIKHADKKLGRRSAPRYALMCEVIIMAPNKSFKTSSLNVSESGALLADNIPTELRGQNFEILFIISQGEKKDYMLFHAKIANPLYIDRVQFVKSIGQSQKKLAQWMDELTPVEV